MKKLVLFLIIFLFPINIYAVSDTARSTIVMDMDSGRILYKKNMNEQRLIASITKIMELWYFFVICCIILMKLILMFNYTRRKNYEGTNNT